MPSMRLFPLPVKLSICNCANTSTLVTTATNRTSSSRPRSDFCAESSQPSRSNPTHSSTQRSPKKYNNWRQSCNLSPSNTAIPLNRLKPSVRNYKNCSKNNLKTHKTLCFRHQTKPKSCDSKTNTFPISDSSSARVASPTTMSTTPLICKT